MAHETVHYHETTPFLTKETIPAVQVLRLFSVLIMGRMLFEGNPYSTIDLIIEAQIASIPAFLAPCPRLGS